jgi:hypothetical protein
MPVSAAGALFHLIDAACEKRSIAINSDIQPSGSTSSCASASPQRPYTGYCTTSTSWSPKATTATVSRKATAATDEAPDLNPDHTHVVGGMMTTDRDNTWPWLVENRWPLSEYNSRRAEISFAPG